MIQKIYSSLSQLPIIYFVPILALLAWCSSPGIFLGDEYVYAENSVNISNGTFINSGHHFDNRFGLLLPMALIVKLLGTHYSVFFIWPFISFLLLLWSLWKIIHVENKSIAFISFLLLAFNPTLLRLSADVAVDLVMTAFMTFAVFFTYHIRQSRFSQAKGGFIVAFVLFYAVFTKMTAIYCFPFFAFLLFTDIRKQQFFKFWRNLILFSLLFYIIYFSTYYFTTGDAFFRFNGFEKTHGAGEVVPWNYRNRPLKDIITRLTLYPVAFFLFAPGYSLLMILGFFSILVGKWREKSALIKYTTIYFLFITGIFWFGSSSLKQYNPVILVERMLLPILPAAALLVASLWTNKNEIVLSKKEVLVKNLICGSLILLCIALFVSRPDKGLGLSFSIFILLLLILTQNRQIRFTPLFISLFFIPFAVQLAYRIFFIVPDIAFFKERKFIQELERKKETTLILTDDRMAEMQAIFLDFKKQKYVKLVDRNSPIKAGNYQNYILHENPNNLLSLSIRAPKEFEKITKFDVVDTLFNSKNCQFYSIQLPKAD